MRGFSEYRDRTPLPVRSLGYRSIGTSMSWFGTRPGVSTTQAYPQARSAGAYHARSAAPVDKPCWGTAADTSQAIAQTKPESSRAIAVITLFCSLPLARRLR